MEKQYICCYESPNINYPPQFFIISNVFETHPFLMGRDRIECHTSYKDCMKILKKARKLLDLTNLLDKSDNIESLFSRIKEQNFVDVVIRKKGKKPIDTDEMRNARSRKSFYYGYVSSEVIQI